RRRHTRYWRDWSSDVCSSDLAAARQTRRGSIRISPPPCRSKLRSDGMLMESCSLLDGCIKNLLKNDHAVFSAQGPYLFSAELGIDDFDGRSEEGSQPIDFLLDRLCHAWA